MVVCIVEVNQRRTWLILGRVTISRQVNHFELSCVFDVLTVLVS